MCFVPSSFLVLLEKFLYYFERLLKNTVEDTKKKYIRIFIYLNEKYFFIFEMPFLLIFFWNLKTKKHCMTHISFNLFLK